MTASGADDARGPWHRRLNPTEVGAPEVDGPEDGEAGGAEDGKGWLDADESSHTSN